MTIPYAPFYLAIDESEDCVKLRHMNEMAGAIASGEAVGVERVLYIPAEAQDMSKTVARVALNIWLESQDIGDVEEHKMPAFILNNIPPLEIERIIAEARQSAADEETYREDVRNTR